MMKGKKRQISDTFKDIYGNVYYEFEDVDPDPEWERIREKLDRERCGSNDTKEENKKMVYLRLVANTQKKRAKPQSPDIESLRWDLDEIPEVPDTPDNPGVNDNPGVGFPHKFRIGVLFPPTTESLPQSHKVPSTSTTPAYAVQISPLKQASVLKIEYDSDETQP
ncbi:hypothetical protein SOVF_125460 [Spinacia oleracea]|nr:hypothetical protein SOVF_125460 [Spinacia oleracea]